LAILTEGINHSIYEFQTHIVRIENNFIRNKSLDLLTKLKTTPTPKDLNFQIEDLLNAYSAPKLYEELHKNNH